MTAIRTQAHIEYDHQVAVQRAHLSRWAYEPIPDWILANLLPLDCIYQARAERRAA